MILMIFNVDFCVPS